MTTNEQQTGTTQYVNAPYGHILATGKLAYYDTFSGLVPCKVTRVYESETLPGLKQVRVTFKLTATRKAYKRGEVLDAPWGSVVPRRAVFVRSGHYIIAGGIVPILDSE